MNFWAATTALSVTTKCTPNPEHMFLGVDASEHKDQETKARILRGEMGGSQAIVLQAGQLKNPDGRITLEPPSQYALLLELASAPQGLKTGDDFRFRRCTWELPGVTPRWKYLCGAPDRTQFVDGASYLIDWGYGDNEFARLQGQSAWGRKGFVLKLMGGVTAARYFGEVFDSNVTALIPNDESDIPAIWEFVRSEEFLRDLRAIEQSVKVNNATVGKVPCDIAHWREIASHSYPVGLPLPESSDPTQWLFNGQPKGSDQPLHVAVARLLGYQWPRQTGSSFPDCPALGRMDSKSTAHPRRHRDAEPCKGRAGSRGSVDRASQTPLAPNGQQRSLTACSRRSAIAGKTLDDWLRDGFFEQHCELFHQRPFVWHIWDGRRDGFHALVNYHRLAAPNGEGRRTLEKLLYTYLGDWIDRQRADQKAGVEGADARVAAAEHLQSRANEHSRGRAALRYLRAVEATRRAADRLGAGHQ